MVLNNTQDVGGNGGEAAVSLQIHGNRRMPYNDQLSTGGGYLHIYMVNQAATSHARDQRGRVGVGVHAVRPPGRATGHAHRSRRLGPVLDSTGLAEEVGQHGEGQSSERGGDRPGPDLLIRNTQTLRHRGRDSLFGRGNQVPGWANTEWQLA